jgi:hypothetical protein
MNRLKDLFEEPTPDESEGDYFTIDTRCESFAVTKEVAADVERVLDEAPLPRWIVFVDLTGARHRMLTRTIERVSECTAAQRAAERAFRRARRQEDKADRRPWEDDD